MGKMTRRKVQAVGQVSKPKRKVGRPPKNEGDKNADLTWKPRYVKKKVKTGLQDEQNVGKRQGLRSYPEPAPSLNENNLARYHRALKPKNRLTKGSIPFNKVNNVKDELAWGCVENILLTAKDMKSLVPGREMTANVVDAELQFLLQEANEGLIVLIPHCLQAKMETLDKNGLEAQKVVAEYKARLTPTRDFLMVVTLVHLRNPDRFVLLLARKRRNIIEVYDAMRAGGTIDDDELIGRIKAFQQTLTFSKGVDDDDMKLWRGWDEQISWNYIDLSDQIPPIQPIEVMTNGERNQVIVDSGVCLCMFMELLTNRASKGIVGRGSNILKKTGEVELRMDLNRARYFRDLDKAKVPPTTEPDETECVDHSLEPALILPQHPQPTIPTAPEILDEQQPYGENDELLQNFCNTETNGTPEQEDIGPQNTQTDYANNGPTLVVEDIAAGPSTQPDTTNVMENQQMACIKIEGNGDNLGLLGNFAGNQHILVEGDNHWQITVGDNSTVVIQGHNFNIITVGLNSQVHIQGDNLGSILAAGKESKELVFIGGAKRGFIL